MTLQEISKYLLTNCCVSNAISTGETILIEDLDVDKIPNEYKNCKVLYITYNYNLKKVEIGIAVY